jgi:hypothetical protein
MEFDHHAKYFQSKTKIKVKNFYLYENLNPDLYVKQSYKSRTFRVQNKKRFCQGILQWRSYGLLEGRVVYSFSQLPVRTAVRLQFEEKAMGQRACFEQQRDHESY